MNADVFLTTVSAHISQQSWNSLGNYVDDLTIIYEGAQNKKNNTRVEINKATKVLRVQL